MPRPLALSLPRAELSRLCTPWTRRRDFLSMLGLAGAGAVMQRTKGFRRSAWAHGSRVFSLGVASGDPTPQGFTIWTRLAPLPLTPRGGMPRRPVDVRYEIAHDRQMRDIVARGHALALPERAHNLRVHVSGLQPNRTYFYRFLAGAEDSLVGRCKTLPRAHAQVRELRLASVSCQDYQNGYYTAYDHLAQEDLDLVLHLGDYIYEYAASIHGPRSHVGEETQTLADYRIRYAQYRLDPALQAAHAAHPFVCTWDDHEVTDNYAAVPAGDPQARHRFAQRRRAAYQAFLEHMPLGPGASRGRLYRSFRFGDLAQIHLLDTRQYRSAQPCRDEELSAGTDLSFACAQRHRSDTTMLGPVQERWLNTALRRDQARWNVLAQQVMMTPWNLQALSPFEGPAIYNMDAWDGYPNARARLLDAIARHRVQNPIVLTGDIHTAWAAELSAGSHDSTPVAAEFVTSSITSSFPDSVVRLVRATLDSNPQIRFFEGERRGYTRMHITPTRWRTDYRGVSGIASPQASVSTLQSLVVQAGSSSISTA